MNQMIHTGLAALVVAVLFGSCAEPETALSDDETIELALQLESTEAGLDVSKIKYFRLRIYPSAPLSAEAETLFDSLNVEGCVRFGGSEVRIKDLKSGENRFVLYEGYSDEQCSQRVAMGLRGGIRIEAESALQKKAASIPCADDAACQTAVHPEATCKCTKPKDEAGKDLDYCTQGSTGTCTVTPPVFIPLYEVGKFNRLPTVSKELQETAAQVSCTVDSDCSAVHKRATCEQGVCRVVGLLPFTPERPKAFHEAITLGDGRLMFVGGFNRIEGVGRFTAGAPFYESFNPRTGAFERPGVGVNFEGTPVAWQRSVLVGGKLLATTGGVSEAEFEYQNGATSPELVVQVPFLRDVSGCASEPCTNASTQLVAAFLDTQDVFTATVPEAVVGHRVAAVTVGESLALLLTGGLVYDSNSQSLAPSQAITQCDLGQLMLQQDPACAVRTDASLLTHRVAHTDLCLARNADGGCSEYLLLGGTGEEGKPGELIASAGQLVRKALGFTKSVGPLETVHFNELATVPVLGKAQERFFLMGGTSGVTLQVVSGNDGVMLKPSTPDVGPQELTINLDTGKFTAQSVDLTALSGAAGAPEDVYRLFHSTVVFPPDAGGSIPNGRVLLVAGLGQDQRPQKSVLVFEDMNTGTLEYRTRLQLNEARFGHTSTLITSGLLAGSVLVVGGLTVDEASGVVKFASSAEIYIP